MVAMQKIREMGEQLGREYRPEKVLLFGSHARGEAGPDSDVDLLVILQTSERTVHMASEMRLKLDHKTPIDLLVRTPAEIGKRLEMGDYFIKRILEEGVTLYEGTDG